MPYILPSAAPLPKGGNHDTRVSLSSRFNNFLVASTKFVKTGKLAVKRGWR